MAEQQLEEHRLDAFEKIDFFRFKEIFYTNDTLWRQLTPAQKSQNFFMMQRNIAIAYPAIMQHFNVIGMNAVNALNACHLFLLGQRQPRWSFISAKKQNVQQHIEVDKLQEKLDTIEDWVKHEFCIANDIDKKCFEDFCRFHKQDAIEQLLELKEQLASTDERVRR